MLKLPTVHAKTEYLENETFCQLQEEYCLLGNGIVTFRKPSVVKLSMKDTCTHLGALSSFYCIIMRYYEYHGMQITSNYIQVMKNRALYYIECLKCTLHCGSIYLQTD